MGATNRELLEEVVEVEKHRLLGTRVRPVSKLSSALSNNFDTVIRDYQRITEDMVVGANSYLGDTRRALSQKPEVLRRSAHRIAKEIELQRLDDDGLAMLLDRLDIRLRSMVRAILRQKNKLHQQPSEKVLPAVEQL